MVKTLKPLVLVADMEKLMFSLDNAYNYYWTKKIHSACLVPSSFYDQETLESLPFFSKLTQVSKILYVVLCKPYLFITFCKNVL